MLELQHTKRMWNDLEGKLGVFTTVFTVGVNYRFQDRAGTYTDVNGAVQEYKGYSVVDCRMAWEKPTYNLFLEANNLFGAKYVDYGNVPQPGAWFIAGVKYRFDL